MRRPRSAFPDEAYRAAGAAILDTAAEVFERAELIVKVKEPQPGEIAMLRKGQVLFTYLHLAADREQTEGLMRSGATCIAYETVTDARGTLPLLSPMSEVAGRMSVKRGRGERAALMPIAVSMPDGGKVRDFQV